MNTKYKIQNTWKLLGVIVLLAGIFIALILVKQSQNVNSSAAGRAGELPPCGDGLDCNYLADGHVAGGTDCRGSANTNYSCCSSGQRRDQTQNPSAARCVDDGCKPPRHMQNGNCIGNPGVGEKLLRYAGKNRCQSDSDCSFGKHCLMGRVCI